MTKKWIILSLNVAPPAGVLLQRLARAGFKVVELEAGPFWDTERDWVSDETGSHELDWEDPHITGGTDPHALGANNSGKGAGGGSVHWVARKMWQICLSVTVPYCQRRARQTLG